MTDATPETNNTALSGQQDDTLAHQICSRLSQWSANGEAVFTLGTTTDLSSLGLIVTPSLPTQAQRDITMPPHGSVLPPLPQATTASFTSILTTQSSTTIDLTSVTSIQASTTAPLQTSTIVDLTSALSSTPSSITQGSTTVDFTSMTTPSLPAINNPSTYWVENGLFVRRSPLLAHSRTEIGLHTEGGIRSTGSTGLGASLRFRTGACFETTERGPQRSFFSEQSISAQLGGGFTPLSQRSSPSEGTSSGLPIGAGGNINTRVGVQEHWSYEKNKVKALAAGAIISIAHAAGAITAGIIAAPYGFRNQSAALCAGIATSSATALLSFCPISRPDSCKISWEVQTNGNATLRLPTGLPGEYAGGTLRGGATIVFEKEFKFGQPVDQDIERIEMGVTGGNTNNGAPTVPPTANHGQERRDAILFLSECTPNEELEGGVVNPGFEEREGTSELYSSNINSSNA